MVKRETVSYQYIKPQLKDFEIVNVIDANFNNGKLSAEGQNNDPSMILNFPGTQIFINKVSFIIKAEHSTVSQLFFQTIEDNGFNEIHSIRVPIKEGENNLNIKLPLKYAITPIQAIRIDPVEDNQKFTLSNVVIN